MEISAFFPSLLSFTKWHVRVKMPYLDCYNANPFSRLGQLVFYEPIQQFSPGLMFYTWSLQRSGVALSYLKNLSLAELPLSYRWFLKEFNTALPLKWLAYRSSSTSTSVFQHWYFGSQVHCVYEGRGVFSPSPPWEFPSVPDSNSLLEPQLYICVCVCVCVRMYTHFRVQLFTFQCA